MARPGSLRDVAVEDGVRRGSGAERGHVAQERAQRGQHEHRVVGVGEPLREVHPLQRPSGQARAGPRSAGRGRCDSRRPRRRAPAPRLPPDSDARRRASSAVEAMALLEMRFQERGGKRAEAEDLAPRADRGQQRLGRRRHEHDVRRRRRLLEALQQRVLRLLRHGVRVVDTMNARALPSKGRAPISRTSVRTCSILMAGVLASGSTWMTITSGCSAALRRAGTAAQRRSRRRFSDAQSKRPRDGEGERALAHALRSRQEQRGRQPAVVERAAHQPRGRDRGRGR